MTARVAALVSSVIAAWAVYEGLALIAAWFGFSAGTFFAMALAEKHLLEGAKLVKQMEVELERERQNQRDTKGVR